MSLPDFSPEAFARETGANAVLNPEHYQRWKRDLFRKLAEQTTKEMQHVVQKINNLICELPRTDEGQ